MSERHPNVIHQDEVAWGERGNGKRFGLRGKRLAHAAGAQRLGCSLFELAPGKRSFPFHYHLANEEAIYLLEGEATARIGDREVVVKAGDFIAMPIGPGHAHQLVNHTDRPVRYLCMSTMQYPEIAVYPDSRKVGILGGTGSVDASGKQLMQLNRHGESLTYWDGEDEI